MATPCSKCAHEAETTGQQRDPSCLDCHPIKFAPDYTEPTMILAVSEVEEMNATIASLTATCAALAEEAGVNPNDIPAAAAALLAERDALLKWKAEAIEAISGIADDCTEADQERVAYVRAFNLAGLDTE